MISEIVYKVPILKTHRFIDLGSGVGQVVLQVSGESGCTDSLGIEKQEIPAEYAEIMGKCFKNMMAWFGKTYGAYSIVHGDFLDQQYLQVLERTFCNPPSMHIKSSLQRIHMADVIFINNFAFGTKVLK